MSVGVHVGVPSHATAVLLRPNLASKIWEMTDLVAAEVGRIDSLGSPWAVSLIGNCKKGQVRSDEISIITRDGIST